MTEYISATHKRLVMHERGIKAWLYFNELTSTYVREVDYTEFQLPDTFIVTVVGGEKLWFTGSTVCYKGEVYTKHSTWDDSRRIKSCSNFCDDSSSGPAVE